MLVVYVLAFTAMILLMAALHRHGLRSLRLPPGPVGVPILGYLPFLDVFHLGKSFSKLADKFGDIFSVRVGTELAIILNSYESVKAAFSRPDMLDRPDTFMFRFFSHGEHGIASASGETWAVQRKFAHKTLKSLGFGTPKMQQLVQEEVSDLVQSLQAKATRSGQVEIGFDINMSIVNVTWALISGERRSKNDVEMRAFVEAVNKGIELASSSGILLFMPFLIKVLPERLFRLGEVRGWMDRAFGFLRKEVDAHKATFEADEEPRNLIDAFLSEMSKPDAHESFSEFQLLVLCQELFGAGGEPTAVTLRWGLHFLAQYPEVQAKAQQELDGMFPDTDAAITYEDRHKLPYVQALVHDIVRLADIHPIGVLHSPSQDTKLEGFSVEKGMFVIPNFHRIHHDPAHWEQPKVLHPEHWLDAEGHFVGAKRDGFLAFGVGRRKCPGQEVALMQLFLFMANLLRHFRFRSVGDGCVETSVGCVISPKPFQLHVQAKH